MGALPPAASGDASSSSSLSLTAGMLYPAVAAISILALERHAVTFSAPEPGSAGEFQGPRVVPDNGADAMRACGELLACCGDGAVPLLSWAALASSEACM